MIAVEARGRLGNQMFQFAFGLAASNRLGADFVFDETELRRWFTLEPRRGAVARARRAAAYRLATRFAPYPAVKVEPDEAPQDVLRRTRDRTSYSGFFQAEGFFAGVAAGVRQAFVPRTEHIRAFRDRYGELLQEGYVCCHVRRTDYLLPAEPLALPLDWYDRCLELVGNQAPVVFVGDDLGDVEHRFSDRDGVRIERNDEIGDLLLLEHARVVVTSNSSFGWWGAWLGTAERVLAPRNWLGFRTGVEFPPGIVPDRWEQVPVEL